MQIGDTAEFGQYEWRVPDIGDGKALHLTEEMTELRAYHNKPGEIGLGTGARRMAFTRVETEGYYHMKKSIIVTILAGATMLFLFGGCSKKKYAVTSNDPFLTGLREYRAGAKVKLVEEIWATDMDYAFYVDGEPADVAFDYNTGFTITFIMPEHDVHVTCETRNSMTYRVPE